MLVTPLPIVMLVRLLQSEKASIPDAGDAIRNRDGRQAAAVGEGIISDAGDTVRNRDARQAVAVVECRVPNAGDAAQES